jgi:hypothetical protein
MKSVFFFWYLPYLFFVTPQLHKKQRYNFGNNAGLDFNSESGFIADGEVKTSEG